MKTLSYALMLSMMIWPVYPSLALATANTTNTNTSTSTSTSTDTNCTSSSETYGGGSFSHCSKNKDKTQENTQGDTKDLNNSGSQQSMMLGMMATAAGAAMVAAGMAPCPTPAGCNVGLIAAGAALIAAGMLGMSAAGKMKNNSGEAGNNEYKMQDIASGNASGTSTTEKGNASGIKIDESFTRTGKSGLVFDDFENKTGIDRDTLANGLKNGRSIADILGDSQKLKNSGYDADKMAATINGASALGADEVMDKLGLTPEELAAMANKNAGMGEDGALAAGTGGSRSPASASTAGLDGLLAGAATNAPATLGGVNGTLSADVQNALDRNGITDLSIFQMVHRKYKTKTPMMFGETSRKPTSTTDNPFSNLGAGGKIEF